MGLCLGVELACLALALGLLFFCYFRFEAFHYWVCRVYALFGYTEAEHKLGEKFLYGKYVEKNEVVCTVQYPGLLIQISDISLAR